VEGSYTRPGSPRRAGPREEARDAARRGRTPSPARCGRKVRDDLRDPPGNETREEETERAGFGRRWAPAWAARLCWAEASGLLRSKEVARELSREIRGPLAYFANGLNKTERKRGREERKAFDILF
jgi:hypothetical protein